MLPLFNGSAATRHLSFGYQASGSILEKVIQVGSSALKYRIKILLEELMTSLMKEKSES